MYHDRDCCDPHQFKTGRLMRSRTLRDSLIFGTRVVRHKGLKVDDSLKIVEYKGHSRLIRDSIVYGKREKRCRHRQCTAWHHFHDFNEEVEKWDFPDQIATNEKKRLWLASRKSVLDQAEIRRKSIPRSRYGELETDAGHYAGEFLRAHLHPWDYGDHPHDMYRATRPSFLTDLNFEDLRAHYDPRPEAIKFHEAKIREFKEWQRVKLLERDMEWELLRVQGVQRCRHHFQHLKDRLQKAKMLWSELNRNSVWFVPWPEGDHVPDLVRRSLMMISKRLSTCAPMWNPNFSDVQVLGNYLKNLEHLAPDVWEQFHYSCKLHEHLSQHKRRVSRLESLARASLSSQTEPPMELPLCDRVIALQNQTAAQLAAMPEYLKPTHKPNSKKAQTDNLDPRRGRPFQDPIMAETEDLNGRPARPSQDSKNQSKLEFTKSLTEVDALLVMVSKTYKVLTSKAHKTAKEKSSTYALQELQDLDVFDEKLGDATTQHLKKGGKARADRKQGKGGRGGNQGSREEGNQGKGARVG